MLPLQETPPLKALLLTRYSRLGASSRLRFLDFIPLLAQHNIHVDVQPFFDDSYLNTKYQNRAVPPVRLIGYYLRRLWVMLRSAQYDLIWLEKEALPFIPWTIEKIFLRRPYAVDFDDAWFLRYQGGNKIIRAVLGQKLECVVSRAAVTIAGNNFLRQWAEKQNSRIVQIPTTVDLTRYQPAPSRPDSFTIGWIGSPSSANYLKPLVPVLSELTAQPNTKLQLIGSGTVTFPGINVEYLPWQEATETTAITQFDVGIMPLTADPWSEGKCSYKLIQYMAAGLPVIASPVGMNTEVVQHGINGFLVETPQEWQSALETLRDNPELRARMGQNGRQRVAEKYDLAVVAPRLAETLKQAAQS